MDFNFSPDSDGIVVSEAAARQIGLATQSYVDSLLFETRRISRANRSDIITVHAVRAAQDAMSLVKNTRALVEELHEVNRSLGDLQKLKQISSIELADIQRKIAAAERRAEEAAQRAHLNEQEVQAVDAQIERTLEKGLTKLEKSSRRREWGLGTVVALIIGLIVGVGSILLVRVIFGF
jgi:predicted  nucleic acid-binding Zn-ribbon protein